MYPQDTALLIMCYTCIAASVWYASFTLCELVKIEEDEEIKEHITQCDKRIETVEIMADKIRQEKIEKVLQHAQNAKKSG